MLRGPAFSHQPERSSSAGIGCSQFAVSSEWTSAFTRHQVGKSLVRRTPVPLCTPSVKAPSPWIYILKAVSCEILVEFKREVDGL